MNRRIIPRIPQLLFCLFSFILNFFQPLFSQSYSTGPEFLFKSHDTTEVVMDDYIDKFFISQSRIPMVFLDTAVVTAPQLVTQRPSPVVGWDSVIHSIKYPELVQRAGISGKLVLKAAIDESGILQEVTVVNSPAKMIEAAVKDALKKIRFIPARANTPINCEMLFLFSFVLKRRVNPDIDTLMVDKSGCLGTCPSYTVTLDKNGGVRYDGHSYVEKKGKWKASMKPSEFLGLTSLIYTMRFFSMKESYPCGWTDFPWITITVKIGQSVKRVSSDFYVPLWEVGLLVDHLTEKLNWERVSE